MTPASLLGRVTRRLGSKARRTRRRAGRSLRRARKAVRRPWKRLARRESPVWRVLRGPRLRLGLYRDSLERMFHAMECSRSRIWFVEIGANDGVAEDPIHLFATRDGWRGVVVEPGPAFARLEATYAGVPGVCLERAAVAETGGSRNFFVLAGDGSLPAYADRLASFNPEVVLANAHRLPDAGARLTSVPVPCLTFGELCEKHGLARVDLLLIDTEGYDFEILKSIDFKRWRPALLVYEHVNLSDADWNACRHHLAEQGYEDRVVDKDTLAIAREAVVEPRLARAWRRLRKDGAQRQPRSCPR